MSNLNMKMFKLDIKTDENYYINCCKTNLLPVSVCYDCLLITNMLHRHKTEIIKVFKTIF